MADALPTPDRLTQIDADASPDEIDWTGQTLGEFRVLHRLGRGGMGQVYLAEQTSLKRKVALKLLNPELASNERSLLRFKNEAENVARATHANIVQIYTIGQANGINYIALEYVEGKNLREFIERKGTPELALGLHIMMQVASALQRANELGIIHRDIKPENIMLTKKGEVKVADFGLSRFTEAAGQPSLTQSQVTMGTPLYMSPEQVERRNIDHRTDIYSFGVTCYYMFAGTPPFRGNSPIDVAYQHVHNDAQPLAEIRPDLPADLCAIVLKMMAKKPEDRYPTAREITRDINRLREALNLGAVAAISISASFVGTPPDALSGSAAQSIADATHAPKRRWYLPLACSILLALGAGALFGWHQHQPAAVDKDPGKGDPVLVDDPSFNQSQKPKADEAELKQLVEKYKNPEGTRQTMTGLEHSLELGLFFIKQKRLGDADAFFVKLSKPTENNVPAYRHLGRLGHAIVLAFKDDSDASNKEFVEILADMAKLEAKAGKKNAGPLKDEVDGFRYLWRDPPMRELVAKALNYNYANNPKSFPSEKLDVYRYPPKPTLKAPPP